MMAGTPGAATAQAKTQEEMAPSSPPSSPPPKPSRKFVQRKIALAFGFEGSGYRGLQISYDIDNVATIENALRQALHAAGAFREPDWKTVRLEKFQWSRSSRTDAGVHARVIVCGCKLGVPVAVASNSNNPEELLLEEFRQAVNAALPGEIRCFSVIKVPKSFDAQKAASWREYSYVIPKGCGVVESPGRGPPRGEVDVTRLRAALQCFVGVHSYHNFCNLKAQNVAPRNSKNGGGTSDGGKGKKGKKGKGKMTAGGGQKGQADKKGGGGARAVVGSTSEAGGPESGEAKKQEHDEDDLVDINAEPDAKRRRKTDDAPGGDHQPVLAASSSIGGSSLAVATATTPPTDKNTPPAPPGADVEEDPTKLDVGDMVDWWRVLIRGVSPNLHLERPLTARFRQRDSTLFKHTLSTIYYFDVAAETDEFLEVRVRGQFFLYNQIRLMVGAAIAHALGLFDKTGGHEDYAGLEVIRAALRSPLECQFPLAPGEGLCLYSSGFSGMDTRSGRMALDADQFEKVHGERVPVGPATELLKDEDRPFVVVSPEVAVREMDFFYTTKIRKFLLDAQRGVYTKWVETSGLLKVNITREARSALLQSSAESGSLTAGATPGGAGSATTSSTAATTAGEVGRRKDAFALFCGPSRNISRYGDCLPQRFTSELLIRFPDRFLPGAKHLRDFQIGLVWKLWGLWTEGRTVHTQSVPV